MKRRILGILAIVLGLLLFVPSITAGGYVHAATPLKAHYLDVGQADCILIQTPGGQNVLIDAGNNDDATTIVNYIKKQGIKKLDIVIGTHPHEDHIGSLDTVINTFSIGTLIMPKVTTTTKTYEDVLTAVARKKLKITVPVPGKVYKLGNTSLTILAPNSSKYDDLNNYSVVTKLTYGSTSFLFEGDAETVSENEMLSKKYNLSATVLKVGHHGSSSGTSTAFLNKVNPRYAIISVGKNNDYGLPSQSTLDRLNSRKIKVYRTDLNGNILVTSDGKNISATVQKAPSTTVPSVRISASVSNTAPKQNTTVYLTVTGPAKARVTAVCNYKTTKTTYYGTIASNGKAVISIKIGRATPNYKVVIDVSVLYNGKTYKTQTYFIPR